MSRNSSPAPDAPDIFLNTVTSCKCHAISTNRCLFLVGKHAVETMQIESVTNSMFIRFRSNLQTVCGWKPPFFDDKRYWEKKRSKEKKEKKKQQKSEMKRFLLKKEGNSMEEKKRIDVESAKFSSHFLLYAKRKAEQKEIRRREKDSEKKSTAGCQGCVTVVRKIRLLVITCFECYSWY